MTLDEAKKIAYVCMQADGGCSTCVANLTEELNSVFPEFVWAYDKDGERNMPMRYGPGEDDVSMYRGIEVHPK